MGSLRPPVRPRPASWAPALALALALPAVGLGCGKSKRSADAPSDAPPGSPPRATAARGAPAARRAWDDPPKLGLLLVGDETPPAQRPVDLSVEADGALRRALLAPGLFAPAAVDDPGACKADLRVLYVLLENDVPNPRATAGVASVAVEGSVFCPMPRGPTDGRGATAPSQDEGGAGPGDPAEDVDELRVSLSDEAPFGPGPGERSATGPQALRLALGRLAGRAAQALYGRVRMRHAPDGAVLAALAAPHAQPGVLAEAAGEAGERRLTGAVDDLVRLTAHEDTSVAVRAGTSLGLLRARRDDVVRALAAMTRGADPERHLAAIQALGDVGGPLAVRYLDTMAVGDPEPALRALARRAARRARGQDPDGDGAPDVAPAP